MKEECQKYGSMMNPIHGLTVGHAKFNYNFFWNESD